MSQVLSYAQELIRRQSITPNDAGCQVWLADKLSQLGFNNQPMLFGEVNNLWSRLGNDKPIFVFAGHTDVVPTGDIEQWQYPPFAATIDNGYLFGRGSADMKSSIAAMLVAVQNFLKLNPQPNINLGFLITADEEGPAIDGTVKVIAALEQRKEKINWCLVGEPTATATVGDVIKNGRRGSLGTELIIKGKQGHVAYPHLAINPIHLATQALDELVKVEWDKGNEFFPATTMQISNINAGTGATNVTPGELKILFNFRFSTEQTAAKLQQKTEKILNNHKLDYQINWQLSGEPFLTKAGDLITAAKFAIKKVVNLDTEISTTGGTSDGRFIAPTGAEVLELGPVNATIHQVNESINIEQLEQLKDIYLELLLLLNTKAANFSLQY